MSITLLDKIAFTEEKIEKTVAPEQIEKEVQDGLAYNDKCMSFLNKVTRFVNKSRGGTSYTGGGPPYIGGPTSAVPNHVRTVKLPKIVLKDFSGDPIEWPSFWDSGA